MKKTFLIALSVLSLTFSPLMIAGVFAQGEAPAAQQTDPKALLNSVGTGLGLSSAADSNSFVTIIGKIIKQILAFVGVILLVIIIWAGFKWMTAQGDSGKVDEAKDMIKNATIGLAIILVSYSLSLFVFDVLLTATGASTVAPAG